MVNSVSKMAPVEVKLKAYYVLIYSKLIHDILSWGKSSYRNTVTLERIIKCAWRVIPYGIWIYDTVFLIFSLYSVNLLG